MGDTPQGFSKEETNFEILDHLIKRVAPAAVRKHFDILIPPDDLAKQLNNNVHVIQQLISKNVINANQQVQLLQVPGTKLPLPPMGGNKATSSADFDITLMICLLRGFKLVPEPIKGWDILPLETDLSLGAHLTRIKIYRNKLAHSAACRIDDKLFRKIFASLKMALSYLSQGETDAIVCEIERHGIDGIHQSYCDIQCNSSVKENTARLLKEWKREIKMFFETSGTLEILNQVKINNAVMITGHSGIGKSATMKYVSFKLEQDGYEVIPIARPDEILNLRYNGRKQLFVIDDILGKYQVNGLLLDLWRRSNDRLQIIFKEKNAKLLCTLRRQLLNGNVQFSLSTVFNRTIVDLDSSELQLSVTEKIGIFENYLTLRKKDVKFDDRDFKIICSSNYAFPLLCSLFSSNSEIFRRGTDFFRSPTIVYREELDRLQIENEEVYCVLVLLVIFDKDELERIFDFTREIIQRDKFDLILQACEVPYSISRNRLCSHLHTLKGTFVGLENPFSFIHDNLEEFIASHFGSCFPAVMLHCCKGDFIRERVRITKSSMDDEHVLIIKHCSFDDFSKRALTDIKNGKFYDILLSEPWQNTEYINHFLSYLKKNEISLGRLEDFHSSDSLLSPFLQAKPKFWNVTNTNRVALIDVLQDKKRLFIYWLVATGNHLLFSHIFGRPKSILRELHEKISIITDLLHIAVLGESMQIIRILINKGGDVNSCDKYGIPLLCKIAGTKRCDIAKFLIEKGANVNQCDEVLGWTPCFVACWFNEIEMLELLLSRGGEVDIFDCKFRTPLAVAVLRNNQKAVSLLVHYNAPIYDYIHEFELPVNSRRILQDALQNKNTKIVEHLLLSGTVSNEICGSFPWSFQSDVVPRMLSLFLDDLKKLTRGPLLNDFVKMSDAIVNHNFTTICNLFRNGEAIKRFSGLHNDRNKKYVRMLSNFHENSLGFSPLHFAAVCDFKKAAQLLLLHGANPFYKDAIGRTSLHLAQSSDMVEILLNTKHKPIEILYTCTPLSTYLKNTLIYFSTFEFVPSAINTLGRSQGILNVKDNFGNTPLHSIVMTATDVAKCLTTLETMIKHGADPCIRCKKGYLPLDHLRTIALYLKEDDLDKGESILGCSKTKSFLKKEKCCLFSFMFLFIIGILLLHLSNATRICNGVSFHNENESVSHFNENQVLFFQGMSVMQLLSMILLHVYVLSDLKFIQCFIFGGIQNTPTRSHLYAEHLFVGFSLKVSEAMIYIRHVEILFFDLSYHVGQQVLNMYCIFFCALLCIIYFPFPLKKSIQKHHILFLRISKAIMSCFVVVWVIVLILCDPISLINKRSKQGRFYIRILYFVFGFLLEKVISWYLFIYLFINRLVRFMFYNTFQPWFWQTKMFSMIATRCILIFVLIDILILPLSMLVCNV